MKTHRLIKIIVDVLLLAIIVLYIMTGYGITNYHLIENLSFSVLTKPVSHLIHMYLIIPFLVLLILHVLLNKLYYVKKLMGR